MTCAIRYGLALATFGMALPVFWTVTEIHSRTVTDANGHSVQMYQGHGIRDPDGHGMPLTNGSVTGGDFRVPHFFALHGIQVLLLITAVLAALAALAVEGVRLRDEEVRARLVRSAALGYPGLVAVVTWQAGRGQSLIHPDTATLLALAAVLLLTAGTTARVIATAERPTAECTPPESPTADRLTAECAPAEPPTAERPTAGPATARPAGIPEPSWPAR
ncbi:hypothetical protein [Streptomyces sp. NRRL S-378]|uniref:hypothetical protein n=1 Tax=Streptomyces sp. NRRL S-378 TaxID=1463904 RepID=UPI00068D4931|nr:hypothetical protein [Streptomyces sp. NRRL S-378]